MPVVYHAKPHSMAWCLECHRAPGEFPSPGRSDYNLNWKPEDVKPADFVAKYGQPQGCDEDWSKKEQPHPTRNRVDLERTLEDSAAT